MQYFWEFIVPLSQEKSAPLQAKKVVEGQPLPNQPDAACGLLMYPILQAADILLYRFVLLHMCEKQMNGGRRPSL